MTIDEFRNEIIEEIYELKGEAFTVESYDVLKNNGVRLHGINLRRQNKKISPTIYLDDLFIKYKKGDTVESIASKILEEEEATLNNRDFDSEFFIKYENVRNKIYIKLINTSKNCELLKEIPNRGFLDLSIVVYCDVTDVCNMDATILVRNQHIERWGVTSEEVINEAISNSENCGIEIRNMMSLIGMNAEDGMYIMTNGKRYGAAAMIFSHVLDEFCDGKSCGVYIIPSSIYEVLLVPGNYVPKGRWDMNNIISEVNEKHLTAEDVLSDHAYYYCPSEGYITV